ncbi:MAG: LytTR family DNA-binding domain-containing protein, partial [Bryobacteraceae bacterium]
PRRLTALLIDDERPARSQLRSLLGAHPEVEVAAEADSADAAHAAVQRVRPDVVFLDIQMPRRSGFDFLAETTAKFAVIFVTAHDEFAVRAFEVNALDYLLKPVEPRRLKQAIERIGRPREGERLGPADRIFTGSRFVPVSSLMAVVASGAYSELWLKDGSRVLLTKPMKDWERRLPEAFKRVHRSTIVNLECVLRAERRDNYSYALHLRGGGVVAMSRREARKQRFD